MLLACLELGTASAQEISKKAEVKRTTAYEILEGLINDGLVSTATKGRTRIYVAERPAKLLRNLQDREKKLEAALPELESLYNVKATKPRVRFYEGVAGIKAVYEDTLTAKDKKLQAILSVQDLFQVHGRDYMNDYVRRRIEAGIRLRVVRSETKEVRNTWPCPSFLCGARGERG